MLPLNRLYLAHSFAKPTFGADPGTLYYIKIADGRRSLIKHTLASGLAQTITTEPPPAGGVGYGSGFFAIQGKVVVYAARDHLEGLDVTTGEQWPVTPSYEGVAAPAIAPGGQFVAFLAEQGGKCNVLLVDVRGQAEPVRLSDNPWYAFNPTFAPDGTRLAWMEWNELDMPWDESRLHIACFAKPATEWQAPYHALPLTISTLSQPNVSYASPQFSPDSQHLAYTSDESGWRSLWVGEADGANARRLDTGEGEIGHPDWVPGQFVARWNGDGSALYVTRRHHSADTLLRIEWPSGTVREIVLPFTEIDDLNVLGEALTFYAATPTVPHTIFTMDTPDSQPVARFTAAVGVLDPSTLSQPEVLSWDTADGDPAWGILYRAVGKQAAESIDEVGASRPFGFTRSDKVANTEPRRPLIVHIHGGPTSEIPLGWNAQAQYFATRGWHYLVVNYRGGTGFGRAYQDKLNGQWGVVDVEDAKSGAHHLIDRGLADAQRLVITGGSAGGYTTLMALTHDPEFWAAGVSLYGIGDMYELKQGSHRFEVNYEQRLIGKLPQTGKKWRERSPLTFVDKVRAPVLLFHGTEDKAVPHQQSVDFANAVKRNGGVAQLISYEGEGHGFVREATRRDLIEVMEAFLEKYVICLQR